MSELASKTVFMTGPDDNLATADIYTQAPATPINNGETVVQGTTAPNATPDTIKASDIVKRVPNAGGDVLARVKNVTGDVAGMSGTFVEKLKEGVTIKEGLAAVVEKGKTDLKGAGMAAGKNILGNDAVMVIDGVSTVRKTGDFKSAAGIVGVMNTISDNPAFAKLDFVGDKLGTLGKIADKLTALRIPGIIDQVMSKLDRLEDQKKFLADNLEAFIRNSDMYSIKLAVDKAGSMACLARVPNAVQMILTYYKIPADQTGPTVAAGNDLLWILNRFDPHWYQYKRNGNWINNLEIFAYASPGASSTLKLFDAYRHLVILAKIYPARDLVDLLRSNFPHAVLR